MPALFPMMAPPEAFSPGDAVRKYIDERAVSPYIGVVTQVLPAIHKVWVQWPLGNEQESPEFLIKVNPNFLGMPVSPCDSGYDSYDKSVSEKLRGQVPKRVMAKDRMAIRIAHTFADKTIGTLIEDIVECHDGGMSDLQAYNRVFDKYATICSDHIMRFSVKRIYENLEEQE